MLYQNRTLTANILALFIAKKLAADKETRKEQIFVSKVENFKATYIKRKMKNHLLIKGPSVDARSQSRLFRMIGYKIALTSDTYQERAKHVFSAFMHDHYVLDTLSHYRISSKMDRLIKVQKRVREFNLGF